MITDKMTGRIENLKLNFNISTTVKKCNYMKSYNLQTPKSSKNDLGIKLLKCVAIYQKEKKLKR